VTLLVDEIVFVFVIPLENLKMKKAKLFVESLEVFVKMIIDTSILKNSFSILITKVPPEWTKEIIDGKL
jgi:hypothetical protein